VIALNRYCAVCKFSRYDHLFHANRTRLYLALAYLFGILSGIVSMLPGFGFHFYPEMFASSYDLNGWLNGYYQWFDRIAWLTIFITLAFCYAAILLKRPTKINSTTMNNNEIARREKKERKLALHFGIIVLVFVSYEINSVVVSLFPVLTNYSFFGLYGTLCYIVFFSCNPYVYFLFNREIREKILHLFGKGVVVTRVTVLTPRMSQDPQLLILP
jgi:NADH:ubiquinone oxidoreductase subunit 3 (subunit A)